MVPQGHCRVELPGPVMALGLGMGTRQHRLHRRSLPTGDNTVTFPSRPAGFGAELSDLLFGYVIPLNLFTVSCSNEADTSHNDSLNLGCPSLCVIDSNILERLEPWFALVQRGACQIVSKAREAQKLGAKAVVVSGEDPDISGKPDTFVNMFSPG